MTLSTCAWFPTNSCCLCGVLVENFYIQTWPFLWPVELMYHYVVRHLKRDISQALSRCLAP